MSQTEAGRQVSAGARQRRLDLEADRRRPGQEVHECEGSRGTGTHVDENVRGTQVHGVDHPKQRVHRRRQIGDAVRRQRGAVVVQLVEPEHQVQPGVSLGQGNVDEGGAEGRRLVDAALDRPACRFG